MAKRKKIKLNIPAPTAPDSKEWELREDSEKIRRYAELRGMNSRHSAAMKNLQREHAGVLDLGGARAPARAGRKRNVGRRTRGRA